MTSGNRGQSSGLRLLMVAMIGAGVAYVAADAGRRHKMVDKLIKWSRRSMHSLDASSRYVGGILYGVVQETFHLQPPDNPNPDDVTLTDRVESELFRDPSVPKGSININSVNGRVELRGELSSQPQIDDLVSKVRRIPGVKDVHSYLHLPGTPAPNKASAIEAS